MTEEHRIFIGIDHPVHGRVTAGLVGTVEANGWAAAVLERALADEAFGGHPVKPYPRSAMNRFARGEILT